MLRDELTPRQFQIVQWIATGMNNAKIGAVLGISIGSVKQHLTRIYFRLRITDPSYSARLQLANRYAREYLVK